MPGGLLALAMLFALAGCTRAPQADPDPQQTCRAMHGQALYSITLAFGLSRPDGGHVTDSEWEDFLQGVVTPRFPAGLSATDAQGQWQEKPGRPVTREPARLVWIMAPWTPELVPSLTAIRETYKKQFNQKSVAAFVHPGCASF